MASLPAMHSLSQPPASPEHDVVPHTPPPRTRASTRRCRRSGMSPKLEDEWLSLAQRFEQFGHGSWVVENGSVTEVLGLLKVVKGCTHGISILSGREALSETSGP